MITYTTKIDEGVTLAVFENAIATYEVTLTGIAESEIQAHLQSQIDALELDIQIQGLA